MAKKTLFSDADFRNKRADSIKVGDKLKGSRVQAIRIERRRGRRGRRIVLEDGRRAWMRDDAHVYDAEFVKP